MLSQNVGSKDYFLHHVFFIFGDKIIHLDNPDDLTPEFLLDDKIFGNK